MGGNGEADVSAEQLQTTPASRNVAENHIAGKTAQASAEAAYPLGERNALLMRSVKSAFALLLTKVTKPAAERRKRVSIEYRNFGGDSYKTNNQRYVR